MRERGRLGKAGIGPSRPFYTKSKGKPVKMIGSRVS